MSSECQTSKETKVSEQLEAQVPFVRSTKFQAQDFEMVSRRLASIVRFLAVFFIIVVIVGLYIAHTVPEFNQYRLVQTYDAPQDPNTLRPRTILLWSGFFGDKRWGLPDDTLGPQVFRDHLKCPVYQCELTNDHDFLPAEEMYDAIVFHTAEPFPFLKPTPLRRSAHQTYVFAQMEPPGETKHILYDEGDFYNLTMTYRLDSDIVWPYLTVYDIETDNIVGPRENPIWRKPPTNWTDPKILELWPGKERTAAWFVSHCGTLSKRDELTAALQQYIDVDVYGKCGTLKCPHSSNHCDKLLDEKYKFYFSFENSLCVDYVTEKLRNALSRNLIPVVYGGSNYTRFLPPQSYIDAESFETVYELSEYLNYLSNNVDEYMKYFWWRRYYRIGFPSPFCDLCKQLHSASFRYKTQSYRNIQDWWLNNSCRFQPKIIL